jgi:two-component system cell cycle response regulator DivK
VNSNRKSPNVKSGTDPLSSSALKRLLVVEDNNLNRLMLDDYLTFCGYQVLSLACGASLFEELASFQPHLILLDLRLPDVDGYLLLEKLQLNPKWQNIPVIIVSAFAFKSDRQRAFNLGARQYFIKPVNLNDLKQAIAQELTNQSN